MADEFVPLPEARGYQYGTILPFAQRPIPYANALQPQLAVPGMIRQPINALAGMAQIPGEAANGALGQAPEQLMQPAARFAEGMLTAGAAPAEQELAGITAAAKAAGHGVEAVEHDPFAGQDMFASTAISKSPSKMNLDLNSGLTHQQDVQDIDNAATAKILKQQAYDRVPMLQNRRLSASPSAANLDVVSGGAHQQMMDEFQAQALRMEDKEFEDRIAHYRAQREAYKQGKNDASASATKFVKEGGT